MTRAASRNFSAWAGSVRFTASRRDRRKCGRCWWRASNCLANCSTSEFSIRGILRGFGLKMGVVTRASFEARVRELCAGQAMLTTIADAVLAARAALRKEYSKRLFLTKRRFI